MRLCSNMGLQRIFSICSKARPNRALDGVCSLLVCFVSAHKHTRVPVFDICHRGEGTLNHGHCIHLGLHRASVNSTASIR